MASKKTPLIPKTFATIFEDQYTGLTKKTFEELRAVEKSADGPFKCLSKGEQIDCLRSNIKLELYRHYEYSKLFMKAMKNRGIPKEMFLQVMSEMWDWFE